MRDGSRFTQHFESMRAAWAAGVSLACLAGAAGAAAPGPRDGFVRMDDMGSGGLLLRTQEPGLFLEAPRVATDVTINVTGAIVRARVTQRFENPSDKWVEGIYVFPLPEDAGVDRLKMLVGDRLIEGKIKERQEARQIYEDAKRAGKKAGLVEQERPNLFTNSVANIGPGETVVVQIEYQERADLKDGVFSVRLPLVVGPRYNPAPDIVEMVSVDGRTGLALASSVPDADRITPPVLHPDKEPQELRLPVSITANIEAGFTLGEITSPYHAIAQTRDRDGHAVVTLAEGATPANSDFLLEWRAADGGQPHAALFKEERDGDTYVLAMVAPPAAKASDAARKPREAVFVIDNSGSMAGPSMLQAKAALLLALEGLKPEDAFNVVRFDHTFEALHPDAVPATPQNVEAAKGFVGRLNAEGGTEMLPALQAALHDPRPHDDSRLRQVVFLTDGAIGNEAELFAAIAEGLGRSRLFTIGIGSAPNSYFMSRAARIGRGTFTHVGDVGEVAARTAQLFAALERPVMTNLTAAFPPGAASEAWPNPLPDLYAGEPVVLTAKLEKAQGKLRIQGDLGAVRWAADLDLAQAAPGEGVAALWARSKIASIEESRFLGAEPAAIDAGVLKTALDFALVSRLTSLVAVDVTPSRPVGEAVIPAAVPTMLPKGWEFEKVFGPAITPFERKAAKDDVRWAALAPSGPEAGAAAERGLDLPRGGTLSALQMGLGGLLLSLGLGLWAFLGRAAPVNRSR